MVHRGIVTSMEQMQCILAQYRDDPPKAAAFDTETTGLHIINDRPFVFQFGWVSEKTLDIYAYAIDLTAQPSDAMIRAWHDTVVSAPIYLAHNVKYDMHMLHNNKTPYMGSNLSDSQFYIRFAHDNISARFGGVLLGLKEYVSKYIDLGAKDHDRLIQAQRSYIAKQYNVKLRAALGWTAARVDAFFDDFTNSIEDLPTVQDYLAYFNWVNTLPAYLQKVRGKITKDDISYAEVDRKLLLDYAIEDIVYALKVYLNTYETIELRGTQEGLRRENEIIPMLWDIERQGFAVDRPYVDESYVRMKRYILQRRADFKELVGMDITVNQHKELHKFFVQQGVILPSMDNDAFNSFLHNHKDHYCADVIRIIQELRTLEKWFSTYLKRFKDVDMVYTQINQVGAATLRMSSDFQQFPKKGLKDKDGNELFNPRRAVRVPVGYDLVAYLDYSQIELRVQALYTLLLGVPDINLCRAYMPLNCTRDGVHYDPNDKGVRDTWHLPGWILDEDGTSDWTPTDVHGATTKAAFNITEADPRYADLRSLGKRVNFARLAIA